MKVALFRVAGDKWAVRTSHTELLCKTIHEAMLAATKYAQTGNYEATDLRSGNV